MSEMNKDAILYLPRSVTFENATTCSKELTQGLLEQAKNFPHVVIDAGAVEHFDSSVLAVLLQFQRDATQSHKTVEVLHMSPQLRELSKLYGVENLLLGGA
ncbi:MAG: STAS domain-containing protein [Saezia sp.]